MERTLFREEHQLLRRSVRAFLDREVVPHQKRWMEAGIVDRDAWRRAGTAGLLCPWLEETHGGPGGDFLHSVVVMEDSRRWLPGCVSGELVTAIAGHRRARVRGLSRARRQSPGRRGLGVLRADGEAFAGTAGGRHRGASGGGADPERHRRLHSGAESVRQADREVSEHAVHPGPVRDRGGGGARVSRSPDRRPRGGEVPGQGMLDGEAVAERGCKGSPRHQRDHEGHHRQADGL